ncbi:cAMP-regulated D2 protein-like [Babylonia areolata]|uniref:cAMP-regulated D2 protein-like n=1 Tax=Babylonia areolata TaxID=304850 RepID=UPI003FD51915
MKACTTVALLATLWTAVWGRGENSPQVTTRFGKIEGLYLDDTVAVYYGVPFASPPVGEMRWKAPLEPKGWGGEVYKATRIKPACPQYDCQRLTPPLVCPTQTSEDCLYLDIYTPRDAAAANDSKKNNGTGYPVMLFIHGGNFDSLAGSSPLFDGRRLAGTRGVVLVTINYRLGALGFLVTGETSDDARGNYGILDQQQALKWVNANIGAFGGDPARVTVFGQSAGAQSTLIHLTSSGSAPYFQNAIMESSPISIPYKRFPEAIVLGGLFAELAGCRPRDLPCLRSKTSEQLAYASHQARSKVSSLKLLEFFEPWGPFVDGDLIKAEPLQLLREGSFSPKPLLMGTTSEETVLYIYSAWNSSVGVQTYAEVVLATYPAHALQILSVYPPTQPSDEREQMVRMSTDLVMACPARNASRLMLRTSPAGGGSFRDVWTYVWNHAFSFPGWGPVFFCEGRVCHGSELVYLFHSEWTGNFTFTRAEEALSAQIMDFWTNFAKTGDPNSPGPSPKPAWPRYGQEEGQWPVFKFQTPQSVVESDYHGKECDFWDTIGYDA